MTGCVALLFAGACTVLRKNLDGSTVEFIPMEAVPRGASSETTYVAREAGERIQMGRSGRLKSFGTHDHQRSRTCAALSGATMTVMSTGVV